MNTLLQVVKIETKKPPIMLELPVDPSISPYLISSTKSLIWREKAFPNNMVRVAIRKDSAENLYSEVVQAIYDVGIECGWENSYPLSKLGLGKAISYLKYYGIDKLEILSSDTNPLSLGSDFDGVKVRVVDWLNNCYAVVPIDKSYLGSISDFGGDYYAVLVHNPSRGIAFSI